MAVSIEKILDDSERACCQFFVFLLTRFFAESTRWTVHLGTDRHLLYFSRATSHVDVAIRALQRSLTRFDLAFQFAAVHVGVAVFVRRSLCFDVFAGSTARAQTLMVGSGFLTQTGRRFQTTDAVLARLKGRRRQRGKDAKQIQRTKKNDLGEIAVRHGHAHALLSDFSNNII